MGKEKSPEERWSWSLDDATDEDEAECEWPRGRPHEEAEEEDEEVVCVRRAGTKTRLAEELERLRVAATSAE